MTDQPITNTREEVPFWRRAPITQVEWINLQRDLREVQQALAKTDPWIIGDDAGGMTCQHCGAAFDPHTSIPDNHRGDCVWRKAVEATKTG